MSQISINHPFRDDSLGRKEFAPGNLHPVKDASW